MVAQRASLQLSSVKIASLFSVSVQRLCRSSPASVLELDEEGQRDMKAVLAVQCLLAVGGCGWAISVENVCYGVLSRQFAWSVCSHIFLP